MTRWVVLGAEGLLGTEVVRALAGRDVRALGRRDADVTDATSLSRACAGAEVVVNCAAWTDVDAAEHSEAEAFAVNALGADRAATTCAASGARLIHISTDFVFDGTATAPYAEDAAPRPLSAYGRTKLAGEWAVRAALPDRSWILRTAWLYGEHGPGFVRTIRRLERERDSISVVADQIGQPTWARDLAERIAAVADSDVPPGVYHATASGSVSRYDLARKVFELVGADPSRVHASTSAQVAAAAQRPAYSVLGHDGWEGTALGPLRAWDEALAEAAPSVLHR